MLIQETEQDLQTYLSSRQGTMTPEQQVKIFNQKMLQCDVRGAVRYLTNREVGGILLPSNTDKKTGLLVAKVLASKDPNARIPDANKLSDYDELPDFADLDITEDVVEQVARRLSRSAGIGGTDSHALTHWLLSFGKASHKLRVAHHGQLSEPSWPGDCSHMKSARESIPLA
jgi:hypothetical protein